MVDWTAGLNMARSLLAGNESTLAFTGASGAKGEVVSVIPHCPTAKAVEMLDGITIKQGSFYPSYRTGSRLVVDKSNTICKKNVVHPFS
jgi:hypothetical protein